MLLDAPINANELPVDEMNFDSIPAGWYSVTVNGAEIKQTKAGTGQYINLGLSITGPSHQGRMVFDIINIRNPNPKAEEIGRKNLGQIMKAVGLAQLQDTDQLVGGSMQVKVSVEDASDPQYGDVNGKQNRIKGYKAVEGGASAMPTAAPAESAPAAGKPSWAK